LVAITAPGASASVGSTALSSPASTAPTSTELAIDRTWLAHERTLMAWVRTATSMISFSFTVYKFFQFEQKGEHHGGLLSPRDFAIFLCGLGTVSLVMATISHHMQIRELKAQLPRRHSLAMALAIVMSVFGLLVMIEAIFHQ